MALAASGGFGAGPFGPLATSGALRRLGGRNILIVPNWHQKLLVVIGARDGKSASLFIRSVVKNLRSDISSDDSESVEPARVLLERLFSKTQKESLSSEDSELSVTIDVLKSEFEVALSTLSKREKDLRAAERQVSLEQRKLAHMKSNLERREEEAKSAYAKQREVEESLLRAQGELDSQARQINNLKLVVKDQDMKIVSFQSMLAVRAAELEKLNQEVAMKDAESSTLRLNIQIMEDQLLQANEASRQQEEKIQELKLEISKKERELAMSYKSRKDTEERLRLAEVELEKQTMGWLEAREELKELAEQASNHTSDIVNMAANDFKRVKVLLDAVKSELVASQESLILSRRQMEEQAQQIEMQALELRDHRSTLVSVSQNLQVALVEADSKVAELSTMHALYNDLQSSLAEEKEMVRILETELASERTKLEHKTDELHSLEKELHQNELECSRLQDSVKEKETELATVSVEVQRLKSQVEAAQQAVEDKNVELDEAQNKITEANCSIAEMQQLLEQKESQLVLATSSLQDKEGLVKTLHLDFEEMKLRASQSKSLIERIALLTSNLVDSDVEDAAAGDFRSSMELESEMEVLRDSLREKEADLAAAERALAVKEEQVTAALARLNSKEEEFEAKKKYQLDDADKLKTLPGLTLEQRLEIEAVQSEAEIAIAALRRIATMTEQLLRDATAKRPVPGVVDSPSLTEAEKEVARLLALTESLVGDANTAGADDTSNASTEQKR